MRPSKNVQRRFRCRNAQSEGDDQPHTHGHGDERKNRTFVVVWVIVCADFVRRVSAYAVCFVPGCCLLPRLLLTQCCAGARRLVPRQLPLVLWVQNHIESLDLIVFWPDQVLHVGGAHMFVALIGIGDGNHHRVIGSWLSRGQVGDRDPGDLKILKGPFL